MTSYDPRIPIGSAPTFVTQLPRPSQFQASNGPIGDVALTIYGPEYEEGRLSSSPATVHHTQFRLHVKIWNIIFTAALFSIFPSLTQLSQLKFTNKSPFETHAFFSNMGVVAYVIAVLTSLLFFAMASYLEKFSIEYSSRLYDIHLILRGVFCFTVILAPLSFVLVLLISNHGYYWIGYLVISLLFVVIVIYNVNDYLELRRKRALRNSGSVQREISMAEQSGPPRV